MILDGTKDVQDIGNLDDLVRRTITSVPDNQRDVTSTNRCPASEFNTDESDLRSECFWSIHIP